MRIQIKYNYFYQLFTYYKILIIINKLKIQINLQAHGGDNDVKKITNSYL